MLYSDIVASIIANPEPQNLSTPSAEDTYYRALQGAEFHLPYLTRIRAAFEWLAQAVPLKPLTANWRL